MTTIGYDKADTTLDTCVDLAFQIVGQTLQRGVELAGQLGRLQDADVVVGEHLGMRRRCSGEQSTVAEVVDEVAERPAKCDVLGLVADRHQCVGDRDAGLDEDGELTREVHQLLLLDLLLAELEVEHPAAFLDLRREQVLPDEDRSRRTDRVGLGHPLDGGAGGVDRGVSELGHGMLRLSIFGLSGRTGF